MKSKQKKILVLLVLFSAAGSLYVYSISKKKEKAVTKAPIAACCAKMTSSTEKTNPDSRSEACVFKTVFEGQYRDSDFIYQTSENVKSAIQKGLEWMVKEQLQDGGWSGGFHASQQILKDPNAKSDPGTTAMVAMAILRCGTDPLDGPYVTQLNRATEFLLKAVEGSGEKDANITQITGTQPQVKLGQNIDVMLTSQYLTNVLGYFDRDSMKKNRVRHCIDKCVAKIQNVQQANGSFNGAGWAGVLQSSIANNALETAASAGIKVDTVALEKSRTYQMNNYNVTNGAVSTADGAGVMLYSISSTGRATANEAVQAKKYIAKAKKEGKIKANAPVTTDNLIKAGLSESQALKYNTAYEVNSSSSAMAVKDDVMNGFGSNGGEEFYSFLQTGEGLIISGDKTWKTWYANVSGKLVKIQEQGGNWQGHHCITSPAFCTAACLLILSVNNDMDRLLAMGNATGAGNR
jgi:hypothetical protein